MSGVEVGVHISVQVVFGCAKAEILDGRPVRVLPDGKSGVVYRGEVYPLHSGNEIHLDDRTYNKGLCPEFVNLPEEINYERNGSTQAGSAASAALAKDRWAPKPAGVTKWLEAEAEALLAKYPAVEDEAHVRALGHGGSDAVWITQAGECYHSDDDCLMLRRGRAKGYEESGHSTRLERVSLSAALGRGRRACRHCG